MNDQHFASKPALLSDIENKCQEIGFDMPADLQAGALLKTLIASKPASLTLELGTGIGASLCWMVEGLDFQSKLVTVDNDPKLIEIAQQFFGSDPRVELCCADGGEWLLNYNGPQFDIIFADAWPGKYSHIETALDLLKIGGLYVVDDMKAQPNWPDGHQDFVDGLTTYLDKRKDLAITKMDWSTGVIVAAKTTGY